MNNRILYFYYLAQSAVLYLGNLVRVRRLQIIALDVRFETVHNKPRAVIYWDVQGCHRINVKTNSIGLSGNAKGISLKSMEKDQVVTIQFKGVFNRIERHVELRGYSGVKQQSKIAPVAFSISLHTGHLQSQISGLSILTKNYEKVKLWNTYAIRSISTSFSESVVRTYISPSPKEFLTVSQKEQTYFQ